MRASSKIYKLQTDTHMIQKLTMELHGIPPPPQKKKNCSTIFKQRLKIKNKNNF